MGSSVLASNGRRGHCSEILVEWKNKLFFHLNYNNVAEMTHFKFQVLVSKLDFFSVESHREHWVVFNLVLCWFPKPQTNWIKKIGRERQAKCKCLLRAGTQTRRGSWALATFTLPRWRRRCPDCGHRLNQFNLSSFLQGIPGNDGRPGRPGPPGQAVSNQTGGSGVQ